MNSAKRTHRRSERINVWLIVIGLAAIALLLACVGFLLSDFTAPTEREGIAEGTNLTEQSTEATAQVIEDMLVETPFCALYYPGKWSDCMRTEHTDLGYGYTVQFYSTCSDGTEALIFSVLFGFGTDNSVNVGTITHNDISTDVNVETVVFSENHFWTAQDADKIQAMQADIAYLIDKLMEYPFFSADDAAHNEVVIPSIVDAIIETPYGLLCFPGIWKDTVRWGTVSSDDGYAVSFLGMINEEEFPLFTFSFQGAADNGFQVGTIRYEGMEVGVYLTLYDAPSEKKWTDAQQHLFAELQDQAYYVLEHLPDNPNYSSVME